MLHNDNKFDQQLRDQLRDHASPVRGDLWRRIHTGIDTPPRLRPWRSLHSLRYLGAGAVTLIAALAAAHYLYVHHTPSNNLARSANHYFTIKSANTTDTTSATHQNTANLTTASKSVEFHQPTTPKPMSPSANATIANAAPANNIPPIITLPTVNYGEFATISPDVSARTTSPATPRATPPAPPRAIRRSVTFPAIARTAPAAPTHTTLFTRIPRPKQPREPDPTTLAKATHPIRLRSISVYGAPATPTSSYAWSWSAGLRATVQLSERWSASAGVQYSRANVPRTQVDRYDSLQPFHFNNWEFPVYAGYTVKGGRTNLSIAAGVIIKASTSYSTTNFHYGWPNPFGYGGYLGAHISRSLTNSFAVFAEPYARFSMTNYRMIVPAQRLSTGVAVGAKYQL
jgi:hypothetical protein